MNRKTYLLLFFLLLAQSALPSELVRKVVIRWDQPEMVTSLSEDGLPAWMLSFHGAVNHDNTGYLPVYCDQLDLKIQFCTAEISVENAVYEPLQLPDPSISLLDEKRIPESLLTFYEVTTDRKQPRLSVYLLPLRINPDSRAPERLISCDLKIWVSSTANPQTGHTKRSYIDQSVLSKGEWYKLSVRKSGIHRITFQDLESYGINPESIDPRNIKLYGNGGQMLNESVSQPRPDDLLENAIFVSGEEDGQFNQGDFILFYAEGPVTWKYNSFYQQYEHRINIYTDKVFYFLTVGDTPGKRITSQPAVGGDPNVIVTKTDDFAYHESDSVNLIKSGKEWYGEVYHNQVTYHYDFNFPYLDLDSPVYFKANLVARSTENSTFTVYQNGEFLVEQEIGSIQINSSIYARTMTTRISDFMPQDNKLRFTIDYDKPGSTSVGWLNYFQVNATSHLVFDGGQKTFRHIASVGAGNIVQFNISNETSVLQVWDITQPTEVSAMEVFRVENGYGMKARADSLREFLAFDGTEFFLPEFAGSVENQNLHGLKPANMIIVVHPPFMAEAIRLADFHRQYGHLTVNVVTPEQIYNEFSSGAQDISAIRDFLKMLYDRNDDSDELRYLLLFGDASYDYKDRIPEDNNLVPTFQSMESLKTASSFVTDDFFGCLDYGEGSNASGTVDIGIGRFPVRTVEESRIVVDKTIHYATSSANVAKSWRNSICLVADDEDNNIHLNQAEELAEIIDSMATCFNINKIFLDSYLQQKSPVGDRYPEASEAIDKAVREGALIVNYTGHGGETGWAGERVLDMPMIMAWDNYDRLPAFVTATCEFSRFDDPGLVSAGEWVLLNPQGGGIGLFTTTRLAYAQSNAALNKRFYQAAFERDSVTGEYPRMGDLMRHAKTPSSQNIKNFVLLGDPATMLAYPFQNVRTLSINNEYSGKETDTLRALSHVTITGQVEDVQGNPLNSFHGLLYPVIYDKPILYKTRANDNSSRVTDFFIQNKVLFKGEVTVANGQFSYSFIVPKDISYQFGPGKISYYAVDTSTYSDAQGFTPVIIGGADALSDTDEQGPAIELFMNDTSFSSGDPTTPAPVFLARLYDESGINTVGNGIGHDLSAIIDGDTKNPLILNSYFIPDMNTYQSGWVVFPLGRQEPGTHTLSFKAWDIYNNSSEATITYVIDTLSPLYVTNAYNYPNPFRAGTNFLFSHNKPGSEFDIVIDIFTINGKHARSLRYEFTSENLESDPLYWNGMDENGAMLGSGIYIYRLRAVIGNGQPAEITRKMIIIH